MAPRGQTLPQATTESAREARKSFFCELCQKGYARMNEFEAHEGSYDHQHKKRLKEMRQLTKDPNAAAKARAAEQRANEEAGLKSISMATMNSSTPASGKKKPAKFISTLQPENAAILGQKEVNPSLDGDLLDENYDPDNDPSGAIRNGWYEDRYEPVPPKKCNGIGCNLHYLVAQILAMDENQDVEMQDPL